MKYSHQFRVPAFIERVAEFHADSASMAAITLPSIVIKVHRALPVLFAFRAWKTKRMLS